MVSPKPDPTANQPLRGDVYDLHCPSCSIMRHMTSTWGTLALIVLQSGTLRFSELRRRVSGVSERMLAQTLQQLEGDGLVIRRSFPVVPPHVEYSLSPLGQQAAAHLTNMVQWIEDNLPQLLGEPNAKAAQP